MKSPSIAIVGPGPLGSALAKHLQGAGYRISEIVCRDRQSLPRSRNLAHGVSAAARTLHKAKLDAEIVWFCVPDGRIESVATRLVEHAWKGKIAVHSCGVLGSDSLASLQRAGASIASAHPLMTFIRGSAPRIAHVPFALEGDGKAVRIVGRIVRDLGARPVPVRPRDKPAYHLFATMVCPLLISLLAASEKAGKLAGMPASEARRRMIPIVRQTISNYEKLGASKAFTGPFVRGDVETVRRHWKVLARSSSIRGVYTALAEAAMRNLPHRNAEQIRAALRGNY